MGFLEAFLLGIVQGLAEFLPISSSGHLVIFQKWLGVENHDLAFDVVVHLGTLLSVLTIYRSVIFRIGRELFVLENWKNIKGGVHLALAVVIATIPTAVIGLLFKDFFTDLFSDIRSVGLLMVFTGTVLFATRWLGQKSFSGISEFRQLPQISFIKAFILGFFQALAIAPGVSRSGMTIVGGLFLKENGKDSALFSFLLAIPAILGAALLQLNDLSFAGGDWGYLLVGLVSSYITGVLGLWFILKVIGRGRLEVFAVYMWLVGLAAFWLG